MPNIDKDVFPPDKDVAKREDKVCRHDSCAPSTCRLDVAADAVDKLRTRLDGLDRLLAR